MLEGSVKLNSIIDANLFKSAFESAQETNSTLAGGAAKETAPEQKEESAPEPTAESKPEEKAEEKVEPAPAAAADEDKKVAGDA
jgi:hypothetical protein